MITLKDLLIRGCIAITVSLVVWLPIAISLHLEGKRFNKSAEKETYTLRQPKFLLSVGTVCTLLFSAGFVLSVCVSDEWIGVFFLPFCVLGMFLLLYAIRWKIIVSGSVLEIYQLRKRPIKLDIQDIERVVQAHNYMTAYKNGKRVFDIETWVVGYHLLYNKLHELGKMESTQNKRSFSVRRSKAEPVIGILGTIFFTGVLVWVIIFPNDTVTPIVYIGFSGFILFCVYLIVASFRWKLKVIDDQLLYCTPLGREKSISIKSIERVKIKKNLISLVSEGKSIIKVEPVYKEYTTLIERLQAEEIPFYYKNKQIEFDS